MQKGSRHLLAPSASLEHPGSPRRKVLFPPSLSPPRSRSRQPRGSASAACLASPDTRPPSDGIASPCLDHLATEKDITCAIKLHFTIHVHIIVKINMKQIMSYRSVVSCARLTTSPCHLFLSSAALLSW